MAINIPHDFQTDTTAQASEVNANFAEIESKAPDKTGTETISGTWTHSAPLVVSAAAGVDTTLVNTDAGTVSAPAVQVGATDVGLYSSGTNALDFATNGTRALGIDSTQFIDSPTQPRASAYNNTTQTIATGVQAPAVLNTEDFDVGGLHDNVTNNTRMTIPTGGDGLYLLTGQVSFASSATGHRAIGFRKNGTTVLGYHQNFTTGAGASHHMPLTIIVNLVAGDYVEMLAVQASGGDLNTGAVVGGAREYSNIFQIVKLW